MAKANICVPSLKGSCVPPLCLQQTPPPADCPYTLVFMHPHTPAHSKQHGNPAQVELWPANPCCIGLCVCVCAPCTHLRMSLLSPEMTPVVNVWSKPKAAGHQKGSNSCHQFDGMPSQTHAALITPRKAYTGRAATAAALQPPAMQNCVASGQPIRYCSVCCR